MGIRSMRRDCNFKDDDQGRSHWKGMVWECTWRRWRKEVQEVKKKSTLISLPTSNIMKMKDGNNSRYLFMYMCTYPDGYGWVDRKIQLGEIYCYKNGLKWQKFFFFIINYLLRNYFCFWAYIHTYMYINHYLIQFWIWDCTESRISFVWIGVFDKEWVFRLTNRAHLYLFKSSLVCFGNVS